MYHQNCSSKSFILHFLFCSPKRLLEIFYLVENVREKKVSYQKDTLLFKIFLLTTVFPKLNSLKSNYSWYKWFIITLGTLINSINIYEVPTVHKLRASCYASFKDISKFPYHKLLKIALLNFLLNDDLNPSVWSVLGSNTALQV